MLLKKLLLVIPILTAMSVLSCNQAGASKNEPRGNAQANVQSASLNNSPTPIPSANSSPNTDESISITSPTEGAQVAHREIVRGSVSDPKAKVWVIIHPMAVADYYVQPRVDVENDGKWSVQCYIGEAEGANIGQHFKIKAVANPKKVLNGGDKLKDWPEAQWQSQIIEVIKK